MQRTSTLEFFGIFPLTLEFFPCETGYAMSPLKPVQAASWQMPSANARATSKVALAPSLDSIGGRHRAAPFGPDLHPLTADHKQRSLVAAVGPCTGGAACLPCLTHSWSAGEEGSCSGPLLEHMCLPISNTRTLALVLVPQILLSLCFSFCLPVAVPFGFS